MFQMRSRGVKFAFKLLCWCTLASQHSKAGTQNEPLQLSALLQRAVLAGDRNQVIDLLKSGATQRLGGTPGAQTALMLAGYKGYTDIVSALLHAEPDVLHAQHTDEARGEARTALHYTLIGWSERNRYAHVPDSTKKWKGSDHTGTLQQLVNASSTEILSVRDTNDNDVLHLACKHRLHVAVQCILNRLQHHSSPGSTDVLKRGEWIATGIALVLASTNTMHKTLGTALISNSAGSTGSGRVSQHIQTALAAWGIHDVCIIHRLLVPPVTPGSAEAFKTTNGTAMRECLSQWTVRLVRDLLSARTFACPQDGDGHAPCSPLPLDGLLQSAVTARSAATVHLLLQWGADPLAENDRGITAVAAAHTLGLPDVLAVLNTAPSIDTSGCQVPETAGDLPTAAGGTVVQCTRARNGERVAETVTVPTGTASPSSDVCAGVGGIYREEARGLTARRFQRTYAWGQLPVLIAGAASEWPAVHDPSGARAWGRSATFRARFGTAHVAVGTIPYARQFGLPQYKIPLEYFLNEDAPPPSPDAYVFDSEFLHQHADAVADIRIPEVFAGVKMHPMQFMLGPPQSGSPVHFHQDAWNACVFGRKLWVLLPANATSISTQSVRTWWAQHTSASDGTRMFVQEPGDVVYVPSGVAHAVINLDWSAAVAVEVYL
eukprot:m.42505 g.42505  ORF g.42505 m.42505 type:complete len:661 (-) comp15032_c0_seq1:1748-3730(-)